MSEHLTDLGNYLLGEQDVYGVSVWRSTSELRVKIHCFQRFMDGSCGRTICLFMCCFPVP
jgi:hypothetical protein